MKISFVHVALFLLCLTLAGCATPVGVNIVSPREAYHDTYANPLSAGVAGDDTNLVLNRFNLLKKFKKEPAKVIATLYEKAITDDRRDILFALAETSYLHGDKLAKSVDPEEKKLAADYFLLAAISSYHFLFSEGPEPPPHALDPRLRTASDLYNFSLWRGFATGENGQLVLEAQSRTLPIGNLTISLNMSAFSLNFADFEKFEPAAKFAVRGFSVRNRNSGMGLPLIGIKKKVPGSLLGGQVAPLTVFLRVESKLAEFSNGGGQAALEFYSTFDNSEITVKEKKIPLEADLTTTLAYKLEGSQLWSFGIGSFFSDAFHALPNGLYQIGTSQPGRIPLVLVHGTASSPAWWSEMFNTLYNDATIRKNFQFWYFIYKSNNVIAMSAGDLRTALREKAAALDPDGKDPALRQMVVVGHSQGGLLTKLTAVDTGEKLVQAVMGKETKDIRTSEKNKKLIRELLVVEPLPFVKRVVFIATPHRGSFLSTHLVRNLIAKLVKLPATLLTKVTDLRELLTDNVKSQLKGRTITSADGMSPENPLLQALADIPLAPGIHGHSIIAIKDEEATPPDGDDGVVKYSSAHLEGMDSEFIVRSEHSCQLHPFTIEEVRRILIEHLASQKQNEQLPQAK